MLVPLPQHESKHESSVSAAEVLTEPNQPGGNVPEIILPPQFECKSSTHAAELVIETTESEVQSLGKLINFIYYE
jgi:hypothetical protein